MDSNLNQLKSKSLVYEPLSRELLQFFLKRKEYREFMSKFRQGPSNFNKMTIDGKTINIPLEFTCINNHYSIKGYNPFNKQLVFNKNFNSGLKQEIVYEMNKLKDMISNPKYFIILNNLEELFKELNTAKMNSDDELVSELKLKIADQYESGGKSYQKMLEKHRLYSKIINNSYNSELSRFSSNLIDSNNYSIKVNELSTIESIASLAPYLIYRSMVKSNEYFTKNSLVTIEEFEDSIIPENMYLVRNIFKPNDAISNDEIISLLSYTGEIIERKYGDLILLDDLNLNINRNYIFNKENDETLNNAEFRDGEPMFNITVDSEGQKLTEDFILTQEEKRRSDISFLNRYNPIKEVVKDTAKKLNKEDSIVNLYPDIDVSFDDNVQLMFYSKSRNTFVGKGSREKISKELEPEYSELNKIKDWRKLLSNFHISRSAKGTIIPIIIDGIKFSSIEHYFHYNKFLDTNLDLSPNEKKRYDEYAERFVLSDEPNSYGKFSGVSVKTKGGKKSGYHHRKNWNSIQENRFKYKDNILIKAMIAKASQFAEYKEALIQTNNSLLIHPKGGNVRSGVYEYATMHMYVRNLLKGEVEHINYDKTSINSDKVKSVEEKSIVQELDTQSQSSSLVEAVAVSPKTTEVEKDVNEEQERLKKEAIAEKEREAAEKRKQVQLKIRQELDIAKQLLLSKGINIEGKGVDDILLEAGLINYLDDTKYFEEYRIINEKLNTDEFGIGGNLVSIPPDGDCLFYSIVEGLKKLNRFPMNFDEDEEHQYSRNTEDLLLIAGDSSSKGPIHREAALELRREVVTKFENNIALGRDEEPINEDQSTLIASIIGDYTTLEDYFEGIGESARPPNNGLWGDANILIAVSALFNVNITVVQVQGANLNYSAEHSKSILPKGPNHNTTSEVLELKLAYLNNGKHYILISDSISIIEDMSSKEKIKGYKYFKHSLGNGNNILGVIVENNDETIALLGIYDINTGKIISKPIGDMKKENFDMIIEKLNQGLETIEEDESALTDITYLKDLENNDIYWVNSKGEEIKIGKFVGEIRDEDGDLETDKGIIFN